MYSYNMKIIKRVIISCLVSIIVLSGVSFWTASAQSIPMTDQQIKLIRDSCVSTKNTLNQLHSSDALLRVNRGQTYESISTKLMERFNSRIVSNSLNNTSLLLITSSYGTTLDSFRADYINYEKQLTLAINIDCSKQPVAFYDAVALARIGRDQVHIDVLKLNQFIDQYGAAVDQFDKDYQGTK